MYLSVYIQLDRNKLVFSIQKELPGRFHTSWEKINTIFFVSFGGSPKRNDLDNLMIRLHCQTYEHSGGELQNKLVLSKKLRVLR